MSRKIKQKRTRSPISWVDDRVAQLHQTDAPTWFHGSSCLVNSPQDSVVTLFLIHLLYSFIIFFTRAIRSRVASGSFDIASGHVCSCQQYFKVSVCGCGWTSSPARVRQIGRRVYLGSGQFFFLISKLLPRGIEGWKEIEIERGDGEWG